MRFKGISRAMLGAMEAHARNRGAARFAVISTTTARRFYLSNGYMPHEWRARSGYNLGMLMHPMVKPIPARARDELD